MYRILMVLMISGWTIAPCRSQEYFDIYSYQKPAGYFSREMNGSRVLSAPDDKLSILMIPVKTAGGNSYMEFGADWELLVASRNTVLGFPNRKTTEFTGGWQMTTGQSYVLNGETKMWIQLRSFLKEGKKASVLFFASDDNQQDVILRFIENLKLDRTPGPAPDINADNQNKIPRSPVEIAPSNKGVEVWMGVSQGSFNMSNDHYSGNQYDLRKNKMSYLVLYPDGNYTGREMPKEGLLSFNKNSPGAGSYTWGRFNRSSEGIHISSAYEDKQLVFQDAGKLREPGKINPLYKCKSVDGLILNGSWSFIPESEKDPYYDQPGCRQVIHFFSNNRFNDRGVFVADCRLPLQYPEEAPGEGSYSINNFTLILKYDDGRTVYKSFTGALGNDPFSKNDVIFIGRIAFFKRNR